MKHFYWFSFEQLTTIWLVVPSCVFLRCYSLISIGTSNTQRQPTSCVTIITKTHEQQHGKREYTEKKSICVNGYLNWLCSCVFSFSKISTVENLGWLGEEDTSCMCKYERKMWKIAKIEKKNKQHTEIT